MVSTGSDGLHGFWAELLGRLHPVLLHLPIGLILALVVLEFPRYFQREKTVRDRSRTILVALLAISTVLGVVSGWLLHVVEPYAAPVGLHEAFGIALGFLSIWVAIAYMKGSRSYSLGVLGVFVLVIPTAHFGVTLTHGSAYWSEPARDGMRASDGTSGAVGTLDEHLVVGKSVRERVEGLTHGAARDYVRVAPIFERYCTACHGASKQDQGLALHTLEAIYAGGDNGPVLLPGEPYDSTLLTNMHGPIDGEAHMPPKGEAQPSKKEIDLLVAWVEGMGLPGGSTGSEDSDARMTTECAKCFGLRLRIHGSQPYGLHMEEIPDPYQFEMWALLPSQALAERYHAKVSLMAEMWGASYDSRTPRIPEASDFREGSWRDDSRDPEALLLLALRNAEVANITEGSNLLTLDFSGAQLGDESLATLLAPFAGIVAELDLSNQDPSRSDLTLIGMMPNLKTLRLRSLQLDDDRFGFDKLSHLQASPSIRVLDLDSTPLSDSDYYYSLAAFPSLKRVTLSGTGMSLGAIEDLRRLRPQLDVVGAGEK